ncbi:MAG: alpha/beta hydrolase [Desulfobacteraceae bacterium]|nr:alpha/beta hydrolase [Desulfobacteraceae bacterium]
MENYSRHYILSGQNRLHYIKSRRDGTAVHFLHANGFNGEMYAPLYRAMGEDYQIIASDVQGHGESQRTETAPVRDWTPFAHNLKDVLSHAATGPVVGIGHSLGGYVTYMAAAMYPELFSKLVLIDPVIFSPSFLALIWGTRVLGLRGKVPLAEGARRRKWKFHSREEAYKRFSGGRGMFSGWSDEFIRSYVDHGLRNVNGSAVLKCSPELEAQVFESIQMDTWKHAGKIKCPALVIRGGCSDVFRKNAARRLEKKIPRCRLVTLENCGHFAPMENPEACVRQIRGFISEKNT